MPEKRGAATEQELHWKIPAEQRQRIQMVLLRESGMMPPSIAAAMGVFAEHGEPRAHGL
jgi:hypothetical protein